ncbi:hypothetical protein SBADM41S_07691 [Streptomyces badius]
MSSLALPSSFRDASAHTGRGSCARIDATASGGPSAVFLSELRPHARVRRRHGPRYVGRTAFPGPLRPCDGHDRLTRRRARGIHGPGDTLRGGLVGTARRRPRHLPGLRSAVLTALLRQRDVRQGVVRLRTAGHPPPGPLQPAGRGHRPRSLGAGAPEPTAGIRRAVAVQPPRLRRTVRQRRPLRSDQAQTLRRGVRTGRLRAGQTHRQRRRLGPHRHRAARRLPPRPQRLRLPQQRSRRTPADADHHRGAHPPRSAGGPQQRPLRRPSPGLEPVLPRLRPAAGLCGRGAGPLAQLPGRHHLVRRGPARRQGPAQHPRDPARRPLGPAGRGPLPQARRLRRGEPALG